MGLRGVFQNYIFAFLLGTIASGTVSNAAPIHSQTSADLTATTQLWLEPLVEQIQKELEKRTHGARAFRNQGIWARAIHTSLYKVINTKKYLEQLLLFAAARYPSAVLFDAVMRTISLTVVQPYFALTGQYWLMPIWTSLPVVESLDVAYLAFRNWLSYQLAERRWHINAEQLGLVRQKLLNSDTIARLLMPEDRESILDSLLKLSPLLALNDRSFQWGTDITSSELEEWIDDPTFILHLQRFTPTPYVYRLMLWRRALSDPKAQEKIWNRQRSSGFQFIKADLATLLKIRQALAQIMAELDSKPMRFKQPWWQRQYDYWTRDFRLRNSVSSLVDLEIEFLALVFQNAPERNKTIEEKLTTIESAMHRDRVLVPLCGKIFAEVL